MEQNDSEIASSTVDSAISVPPSDSAAEELKVIETESEQIRPVFSSNSLVVSKRSVTRRLFILDFFIMRVRSVDIKIYALVSTPLFRSPTLLLWRPLISRI